MATIHYLVTEHDPARPWVVIATGRHTVEIDPAAFWAWALKRWPEPRYGVRIERGM